MLTALPIYDFMRRRLLGRSPVRLEEVAENVSEIAPAEMSAAPPAICLPDQLDRVTGWAFTSEHPRRAMQGGQASVHSPTRAFRLKNVFVVDGVLYKGKFSLHYRPRQHSLGLGSVDRTIDSAAMYCSTIGIMYFANWLADDCVCYPLAAAEGTPLTVSRKLGTHMIEYERLFGMSPERIDNAFIRDVVLFDDVGQNSNKRDRAGELRRKLHAYVPHDQHPGVFIVRGTSGARRVLVNEMEIAERLKLRRGFRIIDPELLTVSEIIAACAGAQVIVSVEGSGLAHGLCILNPGGSLLALQPPKRFVNIFKDITDRNGQNFGFVVGFPEAGDDFRVDVDEVERTLDLFPVAGTRL